MSDVRFPARIMFRFVETLSSELGGETFSSVISKAGLPVAWSEAAHFAALNDEQSALAYGRLQAALRTYYGRGARGILLRIGTKLWERMLEDASFGIKAQSALIRGLPKAMRVKPAMELLAKILSSVKGDISVHPMDTVLIVVDHQSPTTREQKDDEAICFVNQGLIRECLYWATGQEYDIEEHACRALGAKQCEFKIIVGGGL